MIADTTTTDTAPAADTTEADLERALLRYERWDIIADAQEPEAVSEYIEALEARVDALAAERDAAIARAEAAEAERDALRVVADAARVQREAATAVSAMIGHRPVGGDRQLASLDLGAANRALWAALDALPGQPGI